MQLDEVKVLRCGLACRVAFDFVSEKGTHVAGNPQNHCTEREFREWNVNIVSGEQGDNQRTS